MEKVEESELYDRQIRLWGLDAQKRIQNSRVLIFGLGGLGAEICKNLLLAGISGTVADSKLTTADDLSSNFFLDMDDIGTNRATASLPRLQELNAHVNVSACAEDINNLSEEFIKTHSMVILTGVSLHDQINMNKICRSNGIAFFATNAMGNDALLFVDIGPSHTYRTESGSGANIKLSEPMELSCPSLSEASSTPWSNLVNRRFGWLPKEYVNSRILSEFRSLHSRVPNADDTDELFVIGQRLLQAEAVDFEKPFCREDAHILALTAEMEIAPVCAILGGVLGQEVVKFISCKGEPINNFFTLNAVSGSGKVFRLPPR